MVLFFMPNRKYTTRPMNIQIINRSGVTSGRIKIRMPRETIQSTGIRGITIGVGTAGHWYHVIRILNRSS